MSYCDNCIHQQVCRFTKDIKRHECSPVEYLSGYTDGPTIRYAVDCPYKVMGYPDGTYFGEASESVH